MYSVAVVGAGPAGSTAARTLSEMGHEVVLIDRKEVVGLPKQCAEGLFAACFPEFSTSPGEFITGKVRYLKVVFPDQTSYRLRGDLLMLDRPRFDQHLLGLAERSGADLVLGQKVEGIDPYSGEVRLRGGETIRAKAIVVLTVPPPGSEGPLD